MMTSARDLLDAVDRLPEAERVTFVAEILRRVSIVAIPPLEDVDLTLAAEELFLELDAREAADAQPESR